MAAISTQNGPEITLPVANPETFNGKQDYLVAVDATGKAVLYGAATNPPIGTFAGRNFPQDPSIRVRIFAGGGTFRAIQKATLAVGALVAPDPATGGVIAPASGKIALGVKIGPVSGTNAIGDVIEVLPAPLLG